MDVAALIKIVGLAKSVIEGLPALIESLKGTISATDEAKLKEELVALRATNDQKYGEAQDALAARIAQG